MLSYLTPSPLSGQHQTGATARNDRHREQLLMLVHLTLPSASPSPLHQQLVSQWPLSPPMAHCHQNTRPRLFPPRFFYSCFLPTSPHPTPPPTCSTQVTFQSNCVDVHHRVETDYLEKNKIWSKS